MTLLEEMSVEDLAQRAKDYKLGVPKAATKQQLLEAFAEYYADLAAQERVGVEQDRAMSAARARLEGRH